MPSYFSSPYPPTRTPRPSGYLPASAPKGSLTDILRGFFVPELERQQKRRDPIEEAFFAQVKEPGALFGAASTAAQGQAKELFSAGGEVAQMVARARGKTIGQGFAPEGAEGSENEILRGATQRVADTFAQQAGALEQTRFGALAGAFGSQEAGIRDLLESLFTGTAGAEQLRLSREASDIGGVRRGLRKIPILGGIF